MGGSITHFGFGVFLLGVLISQGKQEVISLNRQGINFGKEFNSNEKNDKYFSSIARIPLCKWAVTK